MRSSFFRLLPIITAVLVTTAPNAVTACEGECIVGITNAWQSNYTAPVYRVFCEIADEICSKLIPGRSASSPPVSLLYPIYEAYRKNVYAALEYGIFPSYFHGKCQRADPHNPGGPLVNPPGCPNPDCPVVCGTPGSLVHFFPKLCQIAHNETQRVLSAFTDPDSEECKVVLKNIVQESQEARRQNGRRSWMGRREVRRADEKKIEEDAKKIIGQIGKKLEKVCGGSDLPYCSWEEEMKKYILSFP